MEIEWATVVPGTESPAGDGVTGAMRCVIAVDGGPTLAAVIKRDPLNMVLAEAFSSLLLRGWGLPVPRPFLVAEEAGLAFASADGGYPNLKRRLNLGDAPPSDVITSTCSLVCGFPSTALAAVADEAIDNRDRNVGNILWDGEDEAWIDHAFALGNGEHLRDINQLCAMACSIGDPSGLGAAAIAKWTSLDRSLTGLVDNTMSSVQDTSQLAAFVSARLSNLGMRLLARFPKPDDLLSNA